MKFIVSGSKRLPHIGLHSVKRQTADRRILVVLMALTDKVTS